MTEILVIALPCLEYFLLKIISQGFGCDAVIFMCGFPVLELVISATVEGGVALAALKQGLFVTECTGWIGVGRWSLSHINLNINNYFNIIYISNLDN